MVESRFASQSNARNPLRVPKVGAHESDILDYKQRFFNYEAAYRCRRMEQMALNLNYYLGRQWIELDREVLLDGTRGYAFMDQRSTGNIEMPRPVSNYTSQAVEVELAALGKRELTPKVVETSRDPRIQAAVRDANDILSTRMERVDWPAKRDLTTFLTIVTGTGGLASKWDETWLETQPLPSPHSVRCPACGTTLADSRVPEQALNGMQHADMAKQVPPDSPKSPNMFDLEICPSCPEPTPMEEYAPTPEETFSGEDPLGRRLGVDVPKGNTDIEVVSPFDLFPENGGIGVTPLSCRTWGQATVRSLDWVEEHYPNRIGDIYPEDPYELMRWHPLLGEWSLLGRYDSATDSGVYDNHVRVFETYSDKSMENPMGHAMIICCDQVLESVPLYEQVQVGEDTYDIPRAKYTAARFKTRHGEFWGRGLVDDLISPQNRVNGTDSLAIDVMERMGSPNLLVSEGMNLKGPAWFDDYGSGRIMRYAIDPVNPQAQPTVFGGVELPMSFIQQREQAIQDMKMIAGPQDVEIGEAPRNITTTGGLQLLGESAEQKRAPRERSLTTAYQVIWEHQLLLLNGKRTEPDTYKAREEDGTWEEREFDRSKLCGVKEVKIEKQAFISRSLWQKEATREAMMDQLYTVDSPLAKKRLLELRGLPDDVNQNWSRQVDRARQQWINFADFGIVPSIDRTLDDPAIHFEVLGTLLQGDEGTHMEQTYGWPAIVRAISGWEAALGQMEVKDLAARAFYGQVIPEPNRPAAYQQAIQQYQVNLQQYQARQQAFEAAVTAAGKGHKAQGPDGKPVADETSAQVAQSIVKVAEFNAMQPPPQPPPEPAFLPEPEEARVMLAWEQQMALAGFQMPPPQVSSAPEEDPGEAQQRQQAFLAFRAVIDAYKRLAEKASQAAALGLQTVAAPGTPVQAIQPPTPGAQPPTAASPRL
jgi:hypothetical protein